jgi:alkyldihydroxyacetonephosphate synthase
LPASKHEFPHLRDVLMDRGLMVELSETATEWSNVLPLYEAITADILRAIAETAVKGWVGCHLSYACHDGTSVYFTYGCLEVPGQ